MFLDGYVCMSACGENPVCVGRRAGKGYRLHSTDPPPSISPSHLHIIRLPCRADDQGGKIVSKWRPGREGSHKNGVLGMWAQALDCTICSMTDCVSSVGLVTHYNKLENFVQECSFFFLNIVLNHPSISVWKVVRLVCVSLCLRACQLTGNYS